MAASQWRIKAKRASGPMCPGGPHTTTCQRCRKMFYMGASKLIDYRGLSFPSAESVRRCSKEVRGYAPPEYLEIVEFQKGHFIHFGRDF